MRRLLFSRYSGPFVALGVLVAVACLASTWYINRLQADLARAVRQDAVGMQAADDLQVQLRHLRVHSLVLVADRTDARRTIVQADLGRIDAALATVHAASVTPEDDELAQQIEHDYRKYQNDLRLERLPVIEGTMADLAKWSDHHPMEGLLVLCRELADRQRQRMNAGLARSDGQTAWAGRVLLALGFLGAFAGLLSGYFTARGLTQQVAQLSVRVRAVRSYLDQDVGAMTVDPPFGFAGLDEQLDRVVERVSAVCRRLQDQERDLLRAEQLAAVGQLAAGVAHEVRNPLTGVKLLLQAALRPHNATPLTADRLRLLLQEVARIERTIQELVDYARTTRLDRQSHDLRSVVEEAAVLAAGRAEVKGVSLAVDGGMDTVPATVDRDQFLSLVTNLLYNAIDAAPTGGTVCAEVRSAEPDTIEVRVTDNGPGIDPRIADRLFDPFATTKPTGTGLGLTVARRVALEHGGTLAAANLPDGGTRFTLTLPTGRIADAEALGRG